MAASADTGHTSPFVSVVTATAGGRLHLLERKLTALVAQTIEPTRIEWVICDDGGREPGLERLVSERPPFEVKTVRQAEATGPAGARNAAIEVAEGEVIYLSDDDCVPAPDTVESHVTALAGGGTVTIGSLRFEPEDAKATTWHPSRVGWWNVNGANTAMTLAALREAGGFDESLKGYGVEDVLLGYELARAGMAFRALPDALSVHVGSDPMDGDDLLKPESAGRNAMSVAKRYPRLAYRLGVSLPLLMVKRALLPPLAAAFGGRMAAELAYARGAWQERES